MITRQRIIFSILSTFLFTGCALVPDHPPQRVVRVKVLVDPAMRQRNADWEREARGLVEAASDYYEREFDIRLITRSVVGWPAQQRVQSTVELLERLKRDFSVELKDADYDLLIAFTGEAASRYIRTGRPRVDRVGNCSQGLGNYLVAPVRQVFRYAGANAELEYDTVALIHELGHIFGAEHVADTQSIMNENFDYRTEFDLKNRGVILNNRNCPFTR